MDDLDRLSIKSLAERRLHNIILEGADLVTQKGFTMVPNYILESPRISAHAKFAYAILLKYAWEKDYCYPGQETMAKDMRVTDRSVRTYLQELEKEGFIEIKQQGQGKPNLYVLKMKASGSDRKIFPVKTGRKR